MAGVTFSHPAVDGALRLRLPPTEVDWSYNLVTSVQDTYAGQVVQILGVNFDKLTITGRIGNEGPWGAYREDGRLRRRTTEDWNTNLPLGVGLVQMTAWFRAYFAVASQGYSREGKRYREEPVTLTYQGSLDIDVDSNRSEQTWLVYPTSFPSYRRANDNFAPEWKVECEVFEAPGPIKERERMAAVDRLAYRPLWSPMNPFSDPIGMAYKNLDADNKRNLTDAAVRAAAQREAEGIIDYFHGFIGELGTTEIQELIVQQASLPATVAPKTYQAGKEAAQDRLREAQSRRRLKDDALRTVDG